MENLGSVRQRLTSVDRVLLCLDFDGTLAPHVDNPDDAELTYDNRQVLALLDQQPALDIAIVSGRALGDLKDRVGMDALTYAGNHGLESDVWTEGESTVHPRVEQYRSTIEEVCAELAHLGVPGIEIENKGATATVHYRNADITPDEIEKRVETIVEKSGEKDLQIVSGREIVEIRPAIDWDKGHAVRQFEDQCQDDCLTIYIGDDTTDEDAFRAIASDGISIYVGTDGETEAMYYVPDVDGVTEFLEWFAMDRVKQNSNAA
jgi:trehalose 6-phosphate phosphatase